MTICSPLENRSVIEFSAVVSKKHVQIYSLVVYYQPMETLHIKLVDASVLAGAAFDELCWSLLQSKDINLSTELEKSE